MGENVHQKQVNVSVRQASKESNVTDHATLANMEKTVAKNVTVITMASAIPKTENVTAVLASKATNVRTNVIMDLLE